MKYEDLDKDTKGIIDSMCQNTLKTKEQSILALVEFGMISMIASISSHSKQQKIMKLVFDAVNKDDKLKKTAEGYSNYWSLDL